jgi:hypothetical protein
MATDYYPKPRSYVMTQQPFEMSFEELIINAIQRRNAAACHEIVRRHIDSKMSLLEYIFDECLEARERGRKHMARSKVNDHAPQPSLGSIDAKTLSIVESVLEYVAIDENDNPDEICRLAREMIKLDPPYEAQRSEDPTKSKNFIYSAADDPKIGSSLNDRGLAFWRWAAIDFKSHRAIIRRGGKV